MSVIVYIGGGTGRSATVFPMLPWVAMLYDGGGSQDSDIVNLGAEVEEEILPDLWRSRSSYTGGGSPMSVGSGMGSTSSYTQSGSWVSRRTEKKRRAC